MPEMTAAEAAEWGKTLSFETVWAALMEDRRRAEEMDERFNKTDEYHKEVGERLDRLGEYLKEVGERVDRTTENIDKMGERVDRTTENIDKMGKKFDSVCENVGGLNRSLGELIEILIAARLWEKFPEYGLKRAYQQIPIYDETNNMKTDIDILLVNTIMCMAVEVKRKLDDTDDVDHHIRRMQLIRKYPPEQIGSKQLVAAMAGGVVDPDVKDYAYQSGFYVLELTGESVHLIPPPENFKPKNW